MVLDAWLWTQEKTEKSEKASRTEKSLSVAPNSSEDVEQRTLPGDSAEDGELDWCLQESQRSDFAVYPEQSSRAVPT